MNGWSSHGSHAVFCRKNEFLYENAVEHVSSGKESTISAPVKSAFFLSGFCEPQVK